MSNSRIPGFYKLSVYQRLELLKERGFIDADTFKLLSSGANILSQEAADKMIENVIGVFSLPIGLGLNFLVNGKDYLVPMVVEEPSIVAAVSSAAKIVRESGGFKSESTEPILIGQVQVMDIEHPSHAKKAILQNKEEILNLANSFHPNMIARGGGAKDLEVFLHTNASHRGDMLVVHLLVDTRDAMGANLVNTMCEGVAGLIEKITGGKVFLRILSNLADRSLVTTECVIPTHLLASKKGFNGEQVRDGIILANEFAMADPYRAATHNKGIMNGIDAVAIATGNDWRAIEASVHAYAARGSHYTSLTQWTKNERGDLVGRIKLPLKVGIVGGPVQSNPSVKPLLKLMNVQTARELMEVMGAVGLAQNFSAIKALSTEGIQQGHMTLHARTVAMAADAPPELFDEVVDRLIESGEIKVWKAEEIVAQLRERKTIPTSTQKESDIRPDLPAGYGKVILFGEHAAVYGSHVIAAPIPIAIQAKVIDADEGVHLIIPRWGVEERLNKDRNREHSIYHSLDVILSELALTNRSMKIEIFPHIPRAMGLGGSAALAVAIVRALSEHFKLNLSDEEVNELAYKSEQIVHGTPSGIDNTMATYGKFILYRRGTPPLIKPLEVTHPIPLVIGITGVESLTARMVANVRNAWEKNKLMYERIFTEINAITLRGMKAILRNDLETLGELMNINQGLLNAIQVSSWELEELIEIARKSGALGAKLTGGGGGGAMIALAATDEVAQEIAANIRKAGYRAIVTQIG
jgi:hydroxymethylglutaryl-CoA reductase